MFLFSFLVATRTIGKVLSNNEYFCFKLPITCSTCIPPSFFQHIVALIVFDHL